MSDDPARVQLLNEAVKVIAGDRDKQYGTPEDSFRAIARHWNAYIHGREFDLTPGDVAAMMILVKVARMESGNLAQADSWLDIAGYAACGYETQHLGEP